MLSHENPIHIFSVFSAATVAWYETHLSPLNFGSTVPYHATNIFIDNLFVWRNQISSTANVRLFIGVASCISIHTRAGSPARSRPRWSAEKCVAWGETFAGLVVVTLCVYGVHTRARYDETYKVAQTFVRSTPATSIWNSGETVEAGENLNGLNLRFFFIWQCCWFCLNVVMWGCEADVVSRANVQTRYESSEVFVTVLHGNFFFCIKKLVTLHPSIRSIVNNRATRLITFIFNSKQQKSTVNYQNKSRDHGYKHDIIVRTYVGLGKIWQSKQS